MKARTKARKRTAARPRSRRKADPLAVVHLPTGAVSLEHQDGVAWREATATVRLAKTRTDEYHTAYVRLRFSTGSAFDQQDDLRSVKCQLRLDWSVHREARVEHGEGFGARFFPVRESDKDGKQKVMIEGTAAEIRALHAALGAAILRASLPHGRDPVEVGET